MNVIDFVLVLRFFAAERGKGEVASKNDDQAAEDPTGDREVHVIGVRGRNGLGNEGDGGSVLAALLDVFHRSRSDDGGTDKGKGAFEEKTIEFADGVVLVRFAIAEEGEASKKRDGKEEESANAKLKGDGAFLIDITSTA